MNEDSDWGKALRELNWPYGIGMSNVELLKVKPVTLEYRYETNNKALIKERKKAQQDFAVRNQQLLQLQEAGKAAKSQYDQAFSDWEHAKRKVEAIEREVTDKKIEASTKKTAIVEAVRAENKRRFCESCKDLMQSLWHAAAYHRDKVQEMLSP